MDWQIEPAGPDALFIRFSAVISPENVPLIRAIRDYLHSHLSATIRDWIPSYTTLMICYDVRHDDYHSLRLKIEALLQTYTPNIEQLDTHLIEIPVYYGTEVGFDLHRIADFHHCSVDTVIQRHSEPVYQVYAIGFAPGFAYLGDVPEALAIPRLATPRQRVPAGSVAIADKQTAVYPIDTPGGWQILGRTALKLFDPQQANVSLLQTGDQVKFIPINKADFLAAGGSLS